MNATTRLAAMLIALTLAFVIGCSGGSNSDSDTPPPPPPPVNGISGIGVAVGPISTFGSIVVNGVPYDTAGATFTIDGSPAIESDLSVGQMVLVRGTIDSELSTGTATSVVSDDSVKGPIESIDAVLNQLTVLGQLVLIGADTSFDDNISPASLDGLSVGEIVEVSGFFTADGRIAASRIEKKAAGTPFEVHGTVSGLDAVTTVFSINDLVVNYSAASLDDFPNGEISEGDFVEAKGPSLNSNGELAATIVELENFGVIGDEGTHVEIEGFITRFVSSTDFDVSGLPVTTDNGTVFEGGVAGDLGLNIKVEVEGELDANGVLVADKVEIRRSKAVRSTAVVDSVDASSDSLVMLTITFTTDSLTRFEDKTDIDVSPLTINDINAGDYLEIRGTEFPAASGQVLATILEREDLDSRTELQGFVSSVAAPSSLTILGVTIDTGAAVFRDVNDSVISASEFFNLVDVDTLVKATGTETGDATIVATEVELESEQ